jgi:hypothetical protein
MLVLGEFSTFVGRKYGFYSFILKGQHSIRKVSKLKGHECSRKVLDLLCNYKSLTLKASSLIFYHKLETSIRKAAVIILYTATPANPIFYNLFFSNGPRSSVGIATVYSVDGPGIESRWGRDFPYLSSPALRPTQPPVQWVPGLSRG